MRLEAYHLSWRFLIDNGRYRACSHNQICNALTLPSKCGLNLIHRDHSEYRSRIAAMVLSAKIMKHVQARVMAGVSHKTLRLRQMRICACSRYLIGLTEAFPLTFGTSQRRHAGVVLDKAPQVRGGDAIQVKTS